jgi:hypothetical protein
VTAGEKDSVGSQEERQSKECCSHRCSFLFFSLVAFLTNFKLKLLMFSKLFRFSCLTAQLEDTHGFRIFNVLSFLGLLYEILFFYIALKLFGLFSFSTHSQLMFAIIDCLAIMAISTLLVFLTASKEENFFKNKEERDRIDIGRKHKKDYDPKNLKISARRMAGMDSRDKLMDIDDSFSSVGDHEGVVVNHNIDSLLMPKRVSNSWVEISLSRNPRHGKGKDKNIFDIDEQQEDYYLPFEFK